MNDINSIGQSVDRVYKRIDAAARRAGRDPAQVTLVAVTKTRNVGEIAQALTAGIGDLGENRVQEATPKIEALRGGPRPRWHLIGHVQRNKARSAASLFDMIHSLDSVRLAEALNRHREAAAAPGQQPLPVLLQVNVSGEASKEGFDLPGGPENRARLPSLLEDVAHVLALPYLQVQGLMTIAPLVSDPEAVRPVFRHLCRLREVLAQHFTAATWAHLSMGMTDDFEVAIEEGATIVRVGRAIFGERPQP